MILYLYVFILFYSLFKCAPAEYGGDVLHPHIYVRPTFERSKPMNGAGIASFRKPSPNYVA